MPAKKEGERGVVSAVSPIELRLLTEYIEEYTFSDTPNLVCSMHKQHTLEVSAAVKSIPLPLNCFISLFNLYLWEGLSDQDAGTRSPSYRF